MSPPGAPWRPLAAIVLRGALALLLLEQGPRGALRCASAAEYVGVGDNYMGQDFFSRWSFFTGADPTHGAVQFLDRALAEAGGMIQADAGRIYIGADTASVGERRSSVRIESKEFFNAGLFVISLDHIPTGCGTWPAFWMYGHDELHEWPVWGEFDIIEGVHRASKVSTTLHTSLGCEQSRLVAGRDFTGGWNQGTAAAAATDCWVKAPGQVENQGCSQHGPEGSIGEPFNAEGGGTFAAEWDPVGLRMRTWFWRKGMEPRDVVAKRPMPDGWGAPYSFFSLADADCPRSHFVDMHMVFDLTFCGDLGSAYFKDGCPEIAANMTCEEFVKNHPEALSEAFWSIRGFDVYQPLGSAQLGLVPTDGWTVFLACLTPCALFFVLTLWGIQRAHDPAAAFSAGSVRNAVRVFVQFKREGTQDNCAWVADLMDGLAQHFPVTLRGHAWEVLQTDGPEGGLRPMPGDTVVATDAFVSSQRWVGKAPPKVGTLGLIESYTSNGYVNVSFKGLSGLTSVPGDQVYMLEIARRRQVVHGLPWRCLAGLVCLILVWSLAVKRD